MTCSLIPQIDSSQFIEKVLLNRANALVNASPGSASLAGQFLDDLAVKLSGQVRFFRIDPDQEEGLAST